jgi:hypothetical protein
LLSLLPALTLTLTLTLTLNVKLSLQNNPYKIFGHFALHHLR